MHYFKQLSKPILIILIAFCAILVFTQAANLKTSVNTPLNLNKYFEELDDLGSQERIVGGKDVPKDKYIPYQISLQYAVRGRNRHFCGGSVITPTRILTAAHCVVGQNASRMSVMAGIRDLNDSTGQRSQLQKYVVHENYEQFVSSDIAMLFIDPPLKLDGERVEAIDYKLAQRVGGGQEVVLTGWGSVHHFGTGPLARYPDILQHLTYSTLSNEDCKETMSTVSDTEICAMERVGKGACNGDSGGPLVMTGTDGKVKQVGVVSYGTSLCASNNPDVYTRVSMFREWIDQLIEENPSNE